MSRAVHYIVALAGSGLFVVIVLALARRGWLSMRYTVGWLVVAICVFVAGVGAGLASPLADALDTEPVYVIIAGGILALLLILLQLSVSASGLIESVRVLAEKVALLEEQLRRLQHERSEGPASPSADRE
jgi:hypothetical protein